MASKTWLKRARLAAAWLLGLYLADIFVRMGWIKFDPEGFWTAAFERWGYPTWLRIAVGAIEVVAASSFLFHGWRRQEAC